jgi:hypothetical protein
MVLRWVSTLTFPSATTALLIGAMALQTNMPPKKNTMMKTPVRAMREASPEGSIGMEMMLISGVGGVDEECRGDRMNQY